MKIAAIDSSGLVASVAIWADDTILAQYSVNYKKTHSQTLLPMLAEIVRMTELDIKTLDAIAVAKGPGSFTGLRIGSATVKGLGQALNKPIIEVPTLDAMAYQLYGVERILCPMLDARRSQVYTGLYSFERKAGKTEFCIIKPQCAASVEEIVENINAIGRPIIYLGDGVPVYEELLRERTRVDYEFAPANCNRQNAAALASLAARYYEQGRFVNAAQHRPEYLRLSQAERERLEREGGI